MEPLEMCPKYLAAQLQFGKPDIYCIECSWCFAFRAFTETCNLNFFLSLTLAQ